MAQDSVVFGRCRQGTTWSGVGPGTTWTSSQPSSPQVSRICLVAWTSSGTVAYSNFLVMGASVVPVPGGDARPVPRPVPAPAAHATAAEELGSVAVSRLQVVSGKGG